MNAHEQSRQLMQRLLNEHIIARDGLIDQLDAILQRNQNDGDGSFDEEAWHAAYVVVREHRALDRKLTYAISLPALPTTTHEQHAVAEQSLADAQPQLDQES